MAPESFLSTLISLCKAQENNRPKPPDPLAAVISLFKLGRVNPEKY
jgi:hypothetical protein